MRGEFEENDELWKTGEGLKLSVDDGIEREDDDALTKATGQESKKKRRANGQLGPSTRRGRENETNLSRSPLRTRSIHDLLSTKVLLPLREDEER